VVSLLAVVLAFHLGSLQSPSQENGYDDYLRAANAASQAGLVELQAYVPPARRTDDYVRPEILSAKVEALNPLEVKRRVAALYRPVAELIHEGNKKAIRLPAPNGDPTTAFPNFARFKGMAKACLLATDGLVADGRTDEAAKQLLDLLEMSEKMAYSGQTENLVFSAVQSMLLTSIKRHISHFSEPDWAFIQERSQAILTLANYRSLWERELQSALVQADDIFPDPSKATSKQREDWASYESDDDPEFQAAIRALARMSPDQMTRAKAAYVTAIKSHFVNFATIMAGPEAQWEPPTPGPLDPSIEYWFHLTTGLSKQFLTILKAERARLRLLRLTAQIQRYTWIYDQLPSKLSDAVPASELRDPLNLKAYGYEPHADGTYRLYSLGVPATGEIEMTGRLNVPDGSGDAP
jgi:hypothetical protein